MAHGGLRPNAGRKKANHTIQAEAMRAYIVARVVAEQEPIVTALIEKAKAGDVPALKEVFERALGKVKENIDLTSKGKEIKGINYIVPRGDNAKADTQTASG